MPASAGGVLVAGVLQVGDAGASRHGRDLRLTEAPLLVGRLRGPRTSALPGRVSPPVLLLSVIVKRPGPANHNIIVHEGIPGRVGNAINISPSAQV
jgi:hypothetical protein